MKILYCWRCRTDTPMLEEHELRLVQEGMRNARLMVEESGFATCAEREPPIDSALQAALDVYESITGIHETNFAALAHHVVDLYGPPCHNCGRPLRTPKAQLCGSCMAPRARP
jgi:hypothetical protein